MWHMIIVETKRSLNQPFRSSAVAAIVDVCKMSLWYKFDMVIATSHGMFSGLEMGRMAGQGRYALWETMCYGVAD